jgi:hypothetical protein
LNNVKNCSVSFETHLPPVDKCENDDDDKTMMTNNNNNTFIIITTVVVRYMLTVVQYIDRPVAGQNVTTDTALFVVDQIFSTQNGIRII